MSFVKVISDLKVVHEYVKMNMLVLYFELIDDSLYKWYEGFPKKGVHLIGEFIKIFLCEMTSSFQRGYWISH